MFKKVFAAMLAGLFISAPAFAEVKMSGSYFIKGNARQSAVKEIDTFRYYESDFEVKTSFIVDENTSADLVLEAFDTNWARADYVAGGAARGAGQNYLEVTKATMTHKFATDTTFSGGVDGNSDSWGTLFGDVAGRGYFLRADQALPFGTLTFRTEKYDEGLVEDNNGDEVTGAGIYDDDLDSDGYLLGLTMDAAGFKVQPALYYSDDQKADVQLSRVMVAAFGKVAAFDIEAEFGYEDVSSNTAEDEGSTFGAWVDAATNVGGLSVNTGLLYSSADDVVSYGVSGELCPMEILGDEVGLDGTTLFRVKVGKSLTEKVAVDFSAAYAFTNKDEGDMRPDFTQAADDKEISGTDLFDKIYEIDANASFKASDAVTLSTGIAYLDGDLADKTSLPQARIDAYAKIAVAF